MKKTGYYTAEHSGRLKECLETEQPISKKTAEKLIFYGIYKEYTYDERIKAYRYILKDLEHDYGLPTWIHHYTERIL